MEQYLEHYGVKGMRWGVRKAPRPSSGRRKGKTNAERIMDSFKQKKAARQSVSTKPAPQKKKTVKDMSDDELRSAINRMQMERTYSQLTAKEVSKGRKFVSDVLYNSAKATATTYTTKAMTKAVEKLLKNTTRSGSS